MSDYQFIKSYLEDFSDLLKPNNELIEKLLEEKKIVFGEELDIDEKLRWHCNDCQTPWGESNDK